MPQDFPGKGAAAGWYNVPGKGTRYYDGSNEFSYGDQHGRIPLGNLLGAANVWGGQFGLGTTRRAGDVVSSLGEGSSTPSKPVPKLPTSPTSPTPGNPPGPPVPQIKSRADVTPLPTTLDEAYGKNGFNLNGRMLGSSIAWNGDGFVNDDPRLTAENLLSSGDKPWVSNDDLPKLESAEQQAELDRAVQQEANWLQQQSSKYDQQGGFTKLEDGTSTTIGPKPGFVDSMTALQAQDKSKKLVYASGKYWVQGEDGKLKAVEGSDSASARDRALAYKRGELSYGDIGGTWDTTGKTTTETASEPVTAADPAVKTSANPFQATSFPTDDNSEAASTQKIGSIKNSSNVYEQMGIETNGKTPTQAMQNEFAKRFNKKQNEVTPLW